MLANPARFAEACRLFDAANAEDPTQEPNDQGQLVPKELLYAERMSAWLARVAPDAPRLPPVAQHAQAVPRRAGRRANGAGRLRCRHNTARAAATA